MEFVPCLTLIPPWKISRLQVVPEIHAILQWPPARHQVRVNVQKLLGPRHRQPIRRAQDQIKSLCGISGPGKVAPHSHHTTSRAERVIRRQQWRRYSGHAEHVEYVVPVDGAFVVARYQQQIAHQIQAAQEAELEVIHGRRLSLRVHESGLINPMHKHGVGQVACPVFAVIGGQLDASPVEVPNRVTDSPGFDRAARNVPPEGHEHLRIRVDLSEYGRIQDQFTDVEQSLSASVARDVRHLGKGARLHNLVRMAGQEDLVA